MVRIRKHDGKVGVVSQADAVELLDVQGRLVCVIIQQGELTTRVLTPGDPVFAAYAISHGLKQGHTIVHELTDVKHGN